jgi:hypothetical protein
MKLVTFEVSTPIGPLQRIGAIQQNNIIDLNMGYTTYLADKRGSHRAYDLASAVLPPYMIAFFRSGQEGIEAAETTIDYVVKQRLRYPGLTPFEIISPSRDMPAFPARGSSTKAGTRYPYATRAIPTRLSVPRKSSPGLSSPTCWTTSWNTAFTSAKRARTYHGKEHRNTSPATPS